MWIGFETPREEDLEDTSPIQPKRDPLAKVGSFETDRFKKGRL